MSRRFAGSLLLLALAACTPAGSPPPPTTPIPAVTAPTSPPAAVFTATSSPIPPTGTPLPPTATAAPSPTAAPQISATATPLPPPQFGFTYQRPDGNRLLAGQGNLPDVSPLDIPLDGVPQWVVAAPLDAQSTGWVAVLDDGRTQGFKISADGEVEPLDVTPARLPPGMPPLLRVENGTLSLPVSPADAAAPETHPVFLPTDDSMVSVQAGGDLLVWRGGGEPLSLDVGALPDARILADETGRLLLLTGPTERYGHGVLGDGLEASGITLIETQPEPRVIRTIPIPEPSVVEGIAPIWADLTGDGAREIIVTVSNQAEGARLVVFNESGEQIAAGPAIGQGFRWRHQLAVAPFAPDGVPEVVDVLTPHIGGVVEFYRLEGDELRIAARVPGYTSHVIRTRNLDLAAAGDFDGDGRPELLLPNQSRTELGAIRRTADGAEVAWTLPLAGVQSSNLAGVSLPDGRLWVGVGRQDGSLRVWGPVEN